MRRQGTLSDMQCAPCVFDDGPRPQPAFVSIRPLPGLKARGWYHVGHAQYSPITECTKRSYTKESTMTTFFMTMQKESTLVAIQPRLIICGSVPSSSLIPNPWLTCLEHRSVSSLNTFVLWTWCDRSCFIALLLFSGFRPSEYAYCQCHCSSLPVPHFIFLSAPRSRLSRDPWQLFILARSIPVERPGAFFFAATVAWSQWDRRRKLP